MSSDLDLDAYCSRIGYDGPREPTLAVLHALTAAHAQAVPFENLDVLRGRRIGLDPAALHDKLVLQRRGGYCFEQNGFFLLVLQALGFQVAPLSARVRLDRPRDFIPARTHLFLRVELDGESWLTDVGVGALSLTCALRFVTGIEQSTPHETRRIVHEHGRYFHQALLGSNWVDVYEFTLEEMPLIDREVGNWFTSTHPDSHFKNRLLVARAAPNGVRYTLLNDVFGIRQRDGHAEKRQLQTAQELLDVLAERFGLHFPGGTRFGAGGAPWPNA
jgi:N-hydroxyarylamine O-acetyltransferase